MNPKTLCGLGVLGFLLASILPTTCFRLSTLKVVPVLFTENSNMADQSESTIQQTKRSTLEEVPNASVQKASKVPLSVNIIKSQTTEENKIVQLNERPTVEAAPSASGNSPFDLANNLNISASYTAQQSITECDRTKRTGIVILISFNHFGFEKSNYLMQTTLDIMKQMQSKGNLVRLVIDDSVPVKNTPSNSDKKDWVLTSMVHKLQFDTFSPVRSWEMNVFGFLFVDKTIDFSDPILMREMRRVNFQGIYLYVVIIGEGIDMDIVNRYLVTPNQIIHIPSYDTLHSSLPSKLTEKLCVRPSTHKIHIA